MHNEKIIEPDTRFVTIKAYCKLSGLSYATVDHLLKSGQLKYITTEGGLRRIDTQDTQSNKALIEHLESVRAMLAALLKQFNTQV